LAVRTERGGPLKVKIAGREAAQGESTLHIPAGGEEKGEERVPLDRAGDWGKRGKEPLAAGPEKKGEKSFKGTAQNRAEQQAE